MFTDHIYLINMYKQDLALNNLQVLTSHKIQPTNQFMGPIDIDIGFKWFFTTLVKCHLKH